LLVFGTTNISNAQVSVGVKIGANIADVRSSGVINDLLPNTNSYTGFTVGAIAEIPISNSFSFRPELNYTQKGFSTGLATGFSVIGINLPIGVRANTRINYVETPLLIKYSIGNENAKFYAIAGPTISYAANAHLRPIASLIIDINLPRVNIDLSNDLYNRIEVSATLGASGEIKAGHGKLFADVRYNYGLTNMLSNPLINLTLQNTGVALTAGYAYTF